MRAYTFSRFFPPLFPSFSTGRRFSRPRSHPHPSHHSTSVPVPSVHFSRSQASHLSNSIGTGTSIDRKQNEYCYCCNKRYLELSQVVAAAPPLLRPTRPRSSAVSARGTTRASGGGRAVGSSCYPSRWSVNTLTMILLKRRTIDDFMLKSSRSSKQGVPVDMFESIQRGCWREKVAPGASLPRLAARKITCGSCYRYPRHPHSA